MLQGSPIHSQAQARALLGDSAELLAEPSSRERGVRTFDLGCCRGVG